MQVDMNNSSELSEALSNLSFDQEMAYHIEAISGIASERLSQQIASSGRAYMEGSIGKGGQGEVRAGVEVNW